MKKIIIKSIRAASVLACASATLFCLQVADAAPKISRLTPPSALFSTGDPNPPIIARFLPGQRFDLQATISPDTGQTILSAQFLVDGALIPGSVSWVPTATASGKPAPANTIVASLRAYSTTSPGVHILSITAVQSDNQASTTNGNFQVIPIQPTGLAAKQIILLIGDGMGLAQRTAARIMLKGVLLGKASAPLSMDTFEF